MSKINQALLKEYLELQYPIGKTELFLDNEDHSNYMGFTWQLDAVGKAIVGLDTNDTDFNTIGKTGGNKTDNLSNAYGKFWITNNRIYWKEENSTDWTTNYEGNDNDVHKNNGGLTSQKGLGLGGSVSSVQPYKVFAIWVRTA